MLTQTIADRLVNQSASELPMLLAMAGEPNVGHRYAQLVATADKAFETVQMFSGTPADVFSLPPAFGCDDETFAQIVAAHENAMKARDLYFMAFVKPIIDDAKRVSGRA